MICEVDGLPVHYEVVGEGRPVVFFPRWGEFLRENFELHEPVFAGRQGWRRIYVDPPGHGHTPGDPRITSLDGVLDVLLAFVDAVVGRQRLVVAGASAGGFFARGVVREHAERIDGVLLRVPAVVLDPAERTVPSYRPLIADPEVAKGIDPPPLVQTSEYVAAYRAKDERLYQPSEKLADLPFLERISAGLAGSPLAVDDLAEPCEAPTLIVAGRQDDRTGYQDVWRLLPNYPRATFVVLDRADHDLPVQQEPLYHALVSEWLDRVEEPSRGFALALGGGH